VRRAEVGGGGAIERPRGVSVRKRAGRPRVVFPRYNLRFKQEDMEKINRFLGTRCRVVNVQPHGRGSGGGRERQERERPTAQAPLQDQPLASFALIMRLSMDLRHAINISLML
jgi:hypothetical protein